MHPILGKSSTFIGTPFWPSTFVRLGLRHICRFATFQRSYRRGRGGAASLTPGEAKSQLRTPSDCKRWFPNGGSSSVGERNSATPFLPQLQRRKKRTQPPPKENLLPQRKTFQAGGGYKNPIKTRKTISTTEIFPLWTPYSSAKKNSALEQGGVWFLFPRITLQPEIYAKSIPKTLFHVTDMRFSKTIILKTLFHVILRITDEYVICNFGGN